MAVNFDVMPLENAYSLLPINDSSQVELHFEKMIAALVLSSENIDDDLATLVGHTAMQRIDLCLTAEKCLLASLHSVVANRVRNSLLLDDLHDSQKWTNLCQFRCCHRNDRK